MINTNCYQSSSFSGGGDHFVCIDFAGVRFGIGTPGLEPGRLAPDANPAGARRARGD